MGRKTISKEQNGIELNAVEASFCCFAASASWKQR